MKMNCAWCEQEIVLTADEPTMHLIATIATRAGTVQTEDQIVLHDECRPFWEEWKAT